MGMISQSVFDGGCHVLGVIPKALVPLELFREEREGVRWYVMGDDDSIFFVDNLVDVLSKYDHTKYIYIGGHSESIASNSIYSFDMGFGGAGLILSFPLAKMVQENIEDCFSRYLYLTSADQILMTCVNDFGVSMTAHQGLYQSAFEQQELPVHRDAIQIYHDGCSQGRYNEEKIEVESGMSMNPAIKTLVRRNIGGSFGSQFHFTGHRFLKGIGARY